MNILEISPNQFFKKFIENDRLKSEIEIFNKLSSLENDKIQLIYDFIELLNKNY